MLVHWLCMWCMCLYIYIYNVHTHTHMHVRICLYLYLFLSALRLLCRWKNLSADAESLWAIHHWFPPASHIKHVWPCLFLVNLTQWWADTVLRFPWPSNARFPLAHSWHPGARGIQKNPYFAPLLPYKADAGLHCVEPKCLRLFISQVTACSHGTVRIYRYE